MVEKVGGVAGGDDLELVVLLLDLAEKLDQLAQSTGVEAALEVVDKDELWAFRIYEDCQEPKREQCAVTDARCPDAIAANSIEEKFEAYPLVPEGSPRGTYVRDGRNNRTEPLDNRQELPGILQ